MKQRIKVTKHLSKKCNECGGRLAIVSHIKEIDGVEYVEEYVECQNEDCDFLERIDNKRSRGNKE